MLKFLNNTASQKRFVSINNRTTASDLPESFWHSIAKNSCYINWKNIPLQKSPFQIVTTQALIQELKPKTIIEFGSFKGASALWLADIQSLSVKDGKVISINIDFENIDQAVKGDNRIEFLQGDSNKVEAIFPKEKISEIVHPIVLIEDAHINTIGILEYFHNNIFEEGDYFIIEDTNIDYNNPCYDVWRKTLDEQTCIAKLENLNNKIVRLTSWLKEKKDLYLVDTKYVNYIKEIKDAINNNAEIIHIKNIDQKNYNIMTPYDGEVRVSGIEELIYHMYGVIGIIDSFSVLYKDEDKNIIRAVPPKRNSHNERSSQSPYNDLDWHVDAAYRPMTEKSDNLSPIVDYLIFGIVHKGHENLPIVYISLKDILDILIGCSNELTVTSADSFSCKILSNNIPLLVEHATGYYSRIKMDAIPETQRAAGFLNKIREIVDQESIQNYIYVTSGDIVVLSNKTVLHKRDSYSPKWDGKDRYFIRIYLVKDINQGILANSAQPWIWV